jgi:hypothetical protein
VVQQHRVRGTGGHSLDTQGITALRSSDRSNFTQESMYIVTARQLLLPWFVKTGTGTTLAF